LSKKKSSDDIGSVAWLAPGPESISDREFLWFAAFIVVAALWGIVAPMLAYSKAKTALNDLESFKARFNDSFSEEFRNVCKVKYTQKGHCVDLGGSVFYVPEFDRSVTVSTGALADLQKDKSVEVTFMDCAYEEKRLVSRWH
jgi:hypothetical protein